MGKPGYRINLSASHFFTKPTQVDKYALCKHSFLDFNAKGEGLMLLLLLLLPVLLLLCLEVV